MTDVAVQNREIIDTNDVLHNTLNKHPGGLANHRRTSSLSIFSPLGHSDRRPSRQYSHSHNAVQYAEATTPPAAATDTDLGCTAAGLRRTESIAADEDREDREETMMGTKGNHRSVVILTSEFLKLSAGQWSIFFVVLNYS